MSTSLPVPHHPQLADGYCLPACVQMVLAYWDINRSQERLAKQLQMIPGAGTPGSRVLCLRSRNLDIYYGNGKLNDLKRALDEDLPPIALVNTKHFSHWHVETAHAVVVTALDAATVMFNDPGFDQGPIAAGINDFYLAWDEMACLHSLIRRR